MTDNRGLGLKPVQFLAPPNDHFGSGSALYLPLSTFHLSLPPSGFPFLAHLPNPAKKSGHGLFTEATIRLTEAQGCSEGRVPPFVPFSLLPLKSHPFPLAKPKERALNPLMNKA